MVSAGGKAAQANRFWREEVFTVAVAAGGEGAGGGDGFPEELGGGVVLGFAGELEEAFEADELGDLGVGVEAVEGVASLGEWIEDLLVAEAFGECEVGGVLREGENVGEDFVHAAVFGAEHALEGVIGHVLGDVGGPVGEFDEDVFGEGAGGEEVGVAQAGHDFVKGIPGDAGGAAAVDHVLDLGVVVGEGVDKASLGGVLAFFEIGEDVIDAIFNFVVAGGGVHEGSGSEVVTQRMTMAADVRPGADRFPTAIDIGLGLQAGVDSEIVEHAVGFELQEIVLVALLGIEEGAVEEADVSEGEGLESGWGSGGRGGGLGGRGGGGGVGATRGDAIGGDEQSAGAEGFEDLAACGVVRGGGFIFAGHGGSSGIGESGFASGGSRGHEFKCAS